jgi:BolA protein
MLREERIDKIIRTAFVASFLAIENESHRHHVPQGSETHFKVVLVADAFKGMTRIARHRKINNLLAGELSSGLHALSLHLYTLEEWEQRNKVSHNSPACKDGYRHG